MKELQIFNFNGLNDVRTVIEDDVVWFVAKDIADTLGYSDSQAMTRRLDSDEINTYTDISSGQGRTMTTINESGLYSAILGSKKQYAKEFKKWVTSDVLPTIRKTGKYDVAESEYLLKINEQQQSLFAKEDLISKLEKRNYDLFYGVIKVSSSDAVKCPSHSKKGAKLAGYGKSGDSNRPAKLYEVDKQSPFETISQLATSLSVYDYYIKSILSDRKYLDVYGNPNESASGQYVINNGCIFWSQSFIKMLLQKENLI